MLPRLLSQPLLCDPYFQTFTKSAGYTLQGFYGGITLGWILQSLIGLI